MLRLAHTSCNCVRISPLDSQTSEDSYQYCTKDCARRDAMTSLMGQQGTAEQRRRQYLHDEDSIEDRSSRRRMRAAHYTPRCSIFQELAGEYSVDEIDEDFTRTRRESTSSSEASYIPSSSRLGHLTPAMSRRAGPSRSVDSLTDSIFLAQGLNSSIFEDPVGWESGSDYLFRSIEPSYQSDSFELQSIPRSSVTSSTSTSSSSPSISPSSSPQKSIYSGKSPSKSAYLIKSITSAPSRACSILFRRNSCKISPLGISNYDEPIRYLEMV